MTERDIVALMSLGVLLIVLGSLGVPSLIIDDVRRWWRQR